MSWEDSDPECKKGETPPCRTNLQRKYEDTIADLLKSKNAQDRERGSALQATYQRLKDADEVFHVVRSGGDNSGELTYQGQPGQLYVQMKGSGSLYREMPDVQKLAHEFKHGEQFLDGLIEFQQLKNGKWTGYRDDLTDEANAFLAGFMAEPVGNDQGAFLKSLGQAAIFGLNAVINKLNTPGSPYYGRPPGQVPITNIPPGIYAVPRTK